MDITFVKNSENHIHDEDRGDEQQRQRFKQLAKDERFPLESGLHTRNLLMHLCEAVFDEFRGITDRNVWQEVEVDGDACELVEVIDRLRTNDLLGRCDRAQRHEVGDRASSGRDRSTACSGRAEIATGIAAHVKIIEIGRLGALAVLHFKNYLILVLGLFDQIDVVLGVSRAQQTLHCRSRNTVGSSALAIDIDGEIRCAVVIIRANGSEAFEILQLRHQLIGGGVNVIGHNAAERIGVLPLRLTGRADIDLEYRVRLQNGNDTGNRADRFLQLRDALFNWRALTSRFEKTKNQSLRRRGASSEAGEGEKLRDVWIILQLLVDLLLIGMHLRRRRTFQRNENAPHEAAVARRQQCERQMGKEKPQPEKASEEDRHREPGAIEKFVQDPAIRCDYALNKIAGPFFHSCALMSGPAFAQNPRAHKRSKGEGNESRSENGNDNRDRKFAKDPTQQTGQKYQRNENGGQRQCHRHDGDGNLAGAVKSCLHNRFAVLRASHDVFQENDRVIDQEPDGQSKGHQGQIVNGIVEHIHDRDREQQRQWKRDRRNERIRGTSKEDVDHDHDQDERDRERELHIVNGIDNALGPVEYWDECD